MYKWTFYFLWVVLAGCSTVTSRTHEIVDQSEFKKNSTPSKLLIKFIAFPSTEFTYYIKDPLTTAAQSTGLFSEVNYAEVEIENPKAIPRNNDDQIIQSLYEKMPATELDDSLCVLDVVILPKKINRGFISSLFSALTLGIMPAKREFDYKVGIRLHTRTATTETVLTENYKYEISSIPRKGSHPQITWEKEPLANLIKVAIKEFQTKGLL